MNHRLRNALTVSFIVLLGASTAYAVPRPGASGERLRMLTEGEKAIEKWDPDGADVVARQLLDANPKDAAAIRLSALAAFYRGDYAKAKVLASKAGKEAHMEPALQSVINETYLLSKNWVTKESEHFILYYAPGPDEILAPYALDALEKGRTALAQDLGWSENGKIRVEVYPSSDHFARVSTLTRREIQTTGTIALCKFNRLMITSPRALVHGYPWLDTLVHEYTHLVVVKASHNTVPIWLHEGIAKYEETRWRSEEGGNVDVSIESVLAEAQQRKHFIEFERMHPSIAKLPTAWEAHLAFAEVVSAVAFIKEKAGADALERILRTMKNGTGVKDAVAEVTGIPWSSFDAEWKTYLGAQDLKFRPELTVLPIALKEDLNKPGDDAKEQYHGLKEKTRQFMRIGDLLKNENRMEAAVIEYRKALKAQGTYAPMIGHKIGLAELRGNRLDAATKELKRVLELYPEYAPALVDLADVRMRSDDVKGARLYAGRAVNVNPYDPRAHRLLAEACDRLGDAKCTSRERKALDTLFSARRKRIQR